MTGNLSRFRALSWPQRHILLEAMLLLPLFWVGLRTIGLSRMHSWVSRAPLAARAPRLVVEPATIGALINSAGNHNPFTSTCLTKSLLLIWFLARRGVRGELRIGVRTIKGGIDSHAWVEHEGTPINDTQDVAKRFAAFDGPLSSQSFLSP